MDLAKIAWIEFSTPALGNVAIAALGGDFADWARAQIAPGAWPAPQAFVRALLAAHAREAIDGPAKSGAEIDALSDDDLDEVADALVTASRVAFRPSLVAEGQGPTRKVRKRTDAEVYNLEKAEGETGSARLLRILRDWTQDRADRWRMSMKRSVPEMAQLQHALRASRVLETYKLNFPDIGRLANDALRLKALVPPDFGLAAKMLASQKPAFDHLREMTKTSALMTQIYRDQAQVAETLKLKGVTDLATAVAGLGRYRDVLSHNATLAMVRDQLTMASLASRQFDLRLPGATLAAIGALQSLEAMSEAQRSIFPPGFQITAALGVAGEAPAGPVADVLLHYGEPDEAAPAFGTALETARSADEGDGAEPARLSFLDARLPWLVEMIRNEPDIIRRAGLLVLLAFILQLASTILDGVSAYYAAEQVRLARESAAEAATRSEIDAVLAETRRISAALATAQREQADRDHHLRYVRQRAPLRAEPHGKGLLIRQVYPDQMLRAVDQQGDWLKVEVFDYHSDTPVMGWIYRSWVRAAPAP